MTIKELQSLLFEYEDKKYADFGAKLIPTLPREKFIGIRSPEYKNILKRIKDDPVIPEFLKTLPHKYHEENCLHVQLINRIKDFDECVCELEKFMPYIDNWAVNDGVKGWISSEATYTRRCGMKILMANYLDEDFKAEYPDLPADLRSNEYYVNMMTAWLFAEALTKQWDSAVKFIETNRLDSWTHNKAIQKACESFRVPEERKEYLKSLRVKI